MSRMLSDHIRAVIDQENGEGNPRRTDDPYTDVPHPRTLDKLKHAVSFYNPLNLNPDAYADRVIGKVLEIYEERPKRKG